MLKAVSITGFKNSGKTTLMVELARCLNQKGLRVAAAKFSHHHLDKNKTDTHKLTAIASMVIGLNEDETSIFWPEKRYLPDLLPLVEADILLVEGGKKLTWLPRILTPKAEADIAELDNGLALATWGHIQAKTLPAYTDIQQLAELVIEKGFSLPDLNCEACGRASCLELGQEIVRGKASPKACMARRSKLEVTVGGQTLALNPFVERVMTGNLQVMLNELKGYTAGVEVNIKLR